jgi:hypothetical protein
MSPPPLYYLFHAIISYNTDGGRTCYVMMYQIGFQEIVDLNAKSLVVDHSATKMWEEKIDETLRPLASNYVLVCFPTSPSGIFPVL